VEEYPQLPTMPPVAGSVAADVFAEAIGQVTVAASKDDTLPLLTGVKVEISGETMTLMATDRYRLALRELTWNPAPPAPNRPHWCAVGPCTRSPAPCPPAAASTSPCPMTPTAT